MSVNKLEGERLSGIDQSGETTNEDQAVTIPVSSPHGELTIVLPQESISKIKRVREKRRKRQSLPPRTDLDPLKDPPEQVVRTPEGRQRAKEVIATITLENHVAHGVRVDAEVMEKAASILTSHVPRRQLAERLKNMRASRNRYQNGSNPQARKP